MLGWNIDTGERTCYYISQCLSFLIILPRWQQLNYNVVIYVLQDSSYLDKIARYRCCQSDVTECYSPFYLLLMLASATTAPWPRSLNCPGLINFWFTCSKCYNYYSQISDVERSRLRSTSTWRVVNRNDCVAPLTNLLCARLVVLGTHPTHSVYIDYGLLKTNVKHGVSFRQLRLDSSDIFRRSNWWLLSSYV